MLRITQQESASGAKRYYTTADYLSEGQEIVGRWGGKAAELLGLSGQVDKASFERLCDNTHPQTGRALTARTNTDRTVGYDFTFSVPKSVSLLYAMTGDRQLLSAFRESVAETMQDMEAEMKTRVRRGKRDEDRVTGNMVWAEFVHTTSRPVDGVPDPQLHAHCFVFNSTRDETEARWKAGQFRGLKADAPYFQAAFRVRLANRLQNLGFGIDRKRNDFELAGLPAAMLKRFSRRTEEIERVAEERGITDPDRKAELGAVTRERKCKAMSWDELRGDWRERLTEEEQAVLDSAYQRTTRFPREIQGEGQAVTHALDHCFASESVVAERKLLTEAMKRGIGSVTVAGVHAELARRSLIRADQSGKPMVTRPEDLSREEKIIEYARGGRGRFRPPGDPARPCSRDWFNPEQKAAVAHVLGSRDAVTVIQGVAGTGKTTLEQEIGEALTEAGRPVVALAPTAGATEVLSIQAGFASAANIAHFFKNEKLQQSVRGGVILVDEAGMVGLTDMERLFAIASEGNAQIVLLGDTRQHRAVAAGEPMRLLEERAGLPYCAVTEILRQSGHFKKIAEALSQGRVAEAFGDLAGLGWIREIGIDERYHAMVDAYLSAVAERSRDGSFKTALCVTPTHAEAAKITVTLRESLRRQEKLGEERSFARWVPLHLSEPEKRDSANYDLPGLMLQFHQHAPKIKSGTRLVLENGDLPPVAFADRFEVFRPAEIRFAEGDRVRITSNGFSKDGKRLNNGDLFTIDRFTEQGDIVTESGAMIDSKYGHLAHGYAVTSMASQGKTVHKVFVAESTLSLPATNERTFYVPITRAKEQAVVFTDDKQAFLKAVQRPDRPLSALELDEARTRQTRSRGMRRHLSHLRRGATMQRDFETRREQKQQQKEREAYHGR